MRNTEFERFVKKFRKAQDKIILAKGHDYTQGNPDRLHNFKEVARLTGLTPMQVWSAYWLKHVFAICTYVKYGKVKSEGIDERFLDEANYNLLGRAILADEKKSTIGRLVSARASKACPKCGRVGPPAVRINRMGNLEGLIVVCPNIMCTYTLVRIDFAGGIRNPDHPQVA